VLEGRDVLACAQTGSGKTAAFALPLLQALQSAPQQRDPSVLVLAPTRELASQVGEVFSQFALALPTRTRVAVLYGGVSINPQMMRLRGGADVVVATPGRLLDLVQNNALRLGQVQHLVLDEADRLLDLGFSEELQAVLQLLPQRRQNLFFSATFPTAVQALADGLAPESLPELHPRYGVGTTDMAAAFLFGVARLTMPPVLRIELSGALAAGGETIAVIGTGADRIYPARNKELAIAIAERGAIVSEFPLGTPAVAYNFPRRNRIISGLARGVLVVEAAPESGSLITARLAAEQGREVFAIPGSIHSPVARGCHKLIKQGAKLVETAQDILEELGNFAATLTPVAASPAASDESPILAALGHDPCSLDDLVERTGQSADQLLPELLSLELGGSLAPLPGNRYQRLA